MSTSTSPDDKRVILVTGANKGIGYETAKQLAHLLPNATILLGTRTLDNGKAAISKMRSDNDNPTTTTTATALDNIHPIVIDVVDSKTIQKAVEYVKSTYGRLDILIQNSGISNVSGNGLDETVLDVNVDGARAAIEGFLPIIPTTSGLIILVSSTVGTYAAHTLPVELQQVLLREPASMTWPQLQSLRDDWLAWVHNKPSRYNWTPHTEIVGHYQMSKTLVNSYALMQATTHPTPKLVLVCPGFCATDLNGHRGTDPPSKGALSVMWPIFHSDEAKHGVLYLHGKELPYVQEAPEQYIVNIRRMVAEMAAKAKNASEKQ